MNKVNVGLGGISRNTDDGVSKDGMCSELINARPKNGSIEPVGRPILERQFAEGKSPVFVHKNGTYEHLISYANDIVLFDSDKVDGQWVVKNTAFAQIPGVKQIQSVGNILGSWRTGESIHSSIFIGGKYTILVIRFRNRRSVFLVLKKKLPTRMIYRVIWSRQFVFRMSGALQH